MKRVIIVATALLTAASTAASRAHAQSNATNPFSIGVSVGASIPTGDFADGTKTGFNVGVHAGMRRPLWPVGLRLDGQLNRFEDDLGLEAYLNVLGISLNAMVMPTGGASEFRPYIIAGPTFFHLKADVTSVFGPGATSSDNKWGFNAGGGFEYQRSGFATFLEARYNWVKTDDGHIAFVPISVGIMFR